MNSIPNPKRKPRKRKTKDGGVSLSKALIVEKALEIIDRDGIESFSMRSLAKALDVYPTAIYWYIPNRNALIGDVIAAVLSDVLPKNMQSDWMLGLRTLFRNYRNQIRMHPNIAPMIGVQLASNASIDFDLIESILQALKAAGFSQERLPAAYNAVIGTMVGFTTQEFALVPSDDKDNWAGSMQTKISEIDRARYPMANGLMPKLRNKSFILRWENGATAPLDDGFEMSIDAFLLGLEQLSQQ